MSKSVNAVAMATQLRDFLLEQEKQAQLWELDLVFSHGFNLKQATSDMLIYVTADKQARTPFSIILSESCYDALAKQLNNTLSFTLTDDIFWLAGQACFMINKPEQLYDCHAEVFAGQEPIAAAQSRLHESLQIENGLTLESWLQHRLLADTDEIMHLFDDADFEALCNLLIGRGSGLTPSGDDFLLGVLLAQGYNQQLAALMSKLSYKTTRTSGNFFFWATQYRAFHLDFVQLNRLVFHAFDAQTFNEVLARIFAFGHTSGTDFLCGFSYGLQNRNMNIIKENKL